MSERKRVAAYFKLSLADDQDALIREIEVFCKRRRLILVDTIISEASDAQPKLKRLLSLVRSRRHVDLIVTPSFAHLGIEKLLAHLTEIQKACVGVAFAREGLVLPPKAPHFTFAEKYVEGQRQEKSRNIRHSLRVASLLGRALGKPRLAPAVKKEAERHLRTGDKTLREIVKLMNGKISRSSLSNLKREMRRRDGK